MVGGTFQYISIGFRNGRGVSQHLSTFSVDFLIGFIDRKKTSSTFIDLETACNIIIPNISANGLVSYMGFPQGSVLSPLLFNLTMFSFSQCIHPCSNVLLYADDMVLYATNIDTLLLAQIINRSLASSSMWLEDKGLNINSIKTKAILFDKSSHNIPNLILKHSSIPFINSFRIKWGCGPLYWTSICRIRFGHCCTPAHLYRISVKHGDWNHLFFSFRFLTDSPILDNVKNIRHQSPMSIASIMARPH